MKRFTTWVAAAAMAGLVGCVVHSAPGRYDRSDMRISSAVHSELGAEGFRDVTARSVDGTVYLEGRVPDSDARREAGRIAARTDGVERVVNNIEVSRYRAAGDAPDDFERRDPAWEHRHPWHHGGH